VACGRRKWLIATVTAIIVGVATPLLVTELQAQSHASAMPGQPLTASVQLQNTADEGGAWWLPGVLAGSHIDIPNLGNVLSQGHSIDTQYTQILLTVTGNDSQKVVITDIRAKIISRTDLADDGTLIEASPQGSTEDVWLGIDLDEPFPDARIRDDYSEFSARYFSDKTVTIAPDEIVTFGIEASSIDA
jgi:hypothetical protein